MFLCRGGRSAASSISLYYHSAASLQVATNLPQNAVWTLRNSSVISGSHVRDSGANNVYNVRLLSGMLQDESVKSNQCKYVHGSWTGCKSLSRLGFFSPFPWRSGDGNTKNLLSSPKSCFCLPTQTCFFHSSANSVLSSASEQKQAKWTKREAAEEVVLPESSHGEAEKPEPEKKENKTKQLKKVFKEYGAVGVTFHIGISLISLGIFYVAVSSGVNMTAVLCKLGFSDSVVQSKMAAGTSTFVLAYAVHKLFAPFRISITLVSVPLIVRYLRKTGLFKSLPPHL